MMGITEYLESRDLAASDFGPFLFIHTVLSAVLVGSTWWLCYVSAGAIGKMPNHSEVIEKFVSKSEPMPNSVLLNSILVSPMVSDGMKKRAYLALAAIERTSRNSKPVQFIERRIPSIDATRVCVSYAEAKLGRLFFKPVTIPGRIWLSWKGTKLWRQMKPGPRLANEQHCDRSSDAFIAHRNILQRTCAANALESIVIGTKSNAAFVKVMHFGSRSNT